MLVKKNGEPFNRNKCRYPASLTIGDLVSKETVCCVGGKVKHKSKLSTARSMR